MSGFGRKKPYILHEIKMEYYNEKPATRMKKNRLKIIPSGRPIFSL
jgi:hypothetical protein